MHSFTLNKTVLQAILGVEAIFYTKPVFLNQCIVT